MYAQCLMLLLVSFTLACDPPRINFIEALGEFDLIFTGTVISLRQVNDPDATGPYAKTTFQIDHLWKGDLEKRVEVTSALFGCSQTRFKVGDRHIIFATKAVKESGTQPITTITMWH